MHDRADDLAQAWRSVSLLSLTSWCACEHFGFEIWVELVVFVAAKGWRR